MSADGARLTEAATRRPTVSPKKRKTLSACSQATPHVYVFLHQTRLSDVIENDLMPCPAIPSFLSLVDEE